MLAKRIIPCLDVKNGRVVKGTNFVNLKDAGSAIELAQYYSENGADELVFLDITASHEKRKTIVELVREVAKVINIPFTVGGGISSIEQIGEVLNAGADKISLNSAIVNNPKLINESAKKFGSQAVVAAVDVKYTNEEYKVYINGGRRETDLKGIAWIKECENRGAGEILLTSMNHDGTRAGFDTFILGKLLGNLSIPVISSGGAGSMEHFEEAFNCGADACLAAGIFHYQEMEIKNLKKYLNEKNIVVRL